MAATRVDIWRRDGKAKRRRERMWMKKKFGLGEFGKLELGSCWSWEAGVDRSIAASNVVVNAKAQTGHGSAGDRCCGEN